MDRGRDAVQVVIGLEQSLLRPEVRASRESVDALLHEEFTEIGASGRRWTRQELIEELIAAGPLVELKAEEFEGTELAPGMVLLAWKSTTRARSVRRSSLWKFDGGQWRLLFHQGTRVPDGERDSVGAARAPDLYGV